jgi:hypothetical protein
MLDLLLHFIFRYIPLLKKINFSQDLAIVLKFLDGTQTIIYINNLNEGNFHRVLFKKSELSPQIDLGIVESTRLFSIIQTINGTRSDIKEISVRHNTHSDESFLTLPEIVEQNMGFDVLLVLKITSDCILYNRKEHSDVSIDTINTFMEEEIASIDTLLEMS